MRTGHPHVLNILSERMLSALLRFIQTFYEPREQVCDIEHLQEAGDDRAGCTGDHVFDQGHAYQTDDIEAKQSDRAAGDPCHHGNIR